MTRRIFPIIMSGICIAAFLSYDSSFSQTSSPKTPQGTQSKPAPQSSSKASDDEMREFTISAEVDLVLLDVGVRDAQGGFVSGLSKDAFTVFEDGKPQTITQFANQDVPVSMGLIMDNSGSMRSKKPEVVTAALILIHASNPKDEVFVVNFNDKVWRGLPDMVPFTDDPAMLRKALNKTDPAGQTALYDAVLAGLHQLAMGRRDKRTLIVVSDGGDNVSTHTMKQLQEAVLESRATIYTIGVYDEDDRDRNPDVLRKLARVSGGVCYLPKKLPEVEDICRQIAKDVRSRYTIGFVPQNLGKPGQRHLKVAVNSPDHAKLIAHTRTTYLAGGGANTTDRKK
jgi:Ca-activated chloride channel family protein